MARLLPWLLDTDERYRVTSRLFIRVLALIYFAAFFAIAFDIRGLVGEQGILPAGDHLAYLQSGAADIAWLRFPTLFWLNHSDTSLVTAAYAGCGFAVLLFFGWRPLLSSIVLFVLYLSLFQVGQIFFNFQWEYLLLESGFLAIFLLALGPSRLLVFLFHWLLFRLRFLSGLSKLLSGDPAWQSLTTLNHYFETQPLPHIGSWYAHQLPDWLLKTGTGFTLFVELVVPFFIFLPRPFRVFAALATIMIQVLIILTSNHNFINLLTIALCLFLLDDRILARLPLLGRADQVNRPSRPIGKVLLAVVAGALITAGSYSAYEFITDRRAETAWNAPVNWVRGWGLGNVYHVFPNMQTERQELVIEGSDDGRHWRAYRFKFKPNSPDESPPFIVPWHPRLDWMMWFVPPQNPAMRRWFEQFMWRLHANSPDVTALLAHNPFPDHGPRYLRVMAYRFRFTSVEERERTGKIWHTTLLGEFPNVPPRVP
ncbi:lipase maturation factor family protein [Thiosocius teredinicola]|uniref:lipase maturation factor family protein n=1 Tax=Thiosocius teredinicola TaxID=1973002 RepID=UPI0009910E6A